MYRISNAIIASTLLILSFLVAVTPAKVNKAGLKANTGKGTPVLWRDPADIASRNLFYGPGGKAHEPRGTFKFDKEDMAGSCPKFDVIDQDGVKWKVKLGPEVRPETVASRLVWAVGYFANEEYFVPVLRVQNLKRLRRGNNLVSRDGTIPEVRMKRHPANETKIGIWSWSKGPFNGTAEWYGLRVLMAVINNWDLKDVNNAVYLTDSQPAEERYLVSDLGASFGYTGLNLDKGVAAAYCDSKLIRSVSDEFVDFNTPSMPAFNFVANFPEMNKRLHLLWLGRHIPRTNARWMGTQLARLSPGQIRDAFRAGGYSPEDVERLSQVLERRISELEKL
jgi:hypothetical protein